MRVEKKEMKGMKLMRARILFEDELHSRDDGWIIDRLWTGSSSDDVAKRENVPAHKNPPRSRK
jgi:hypothetical protein